MEEERSEAEDLTCLCFRLYGICVVWRWRGETPAFV